MALCYGFRVKVRVGLWRYAMGLVPKLIAVDASVNF